MTERRILYTDAVILLPRLTDTMSLPRYPVITTITLAELSVGPHIASNDIERAARQVLLQQAESDFDPLPFDFAAVARTYRMLGTIFVRWDTSIRLALTRHELPRL